MMKPDEIGVDDIVVHDRLRPVNPDKVKALANSMSEIGLKTPIDVFIEDTEEMGDAPHLIAGRHRVEAAKQLGWKMIDAYIRRDMDEDDRLIWEADENLCRAELTPAEITSHLKVRKEAWARKRAREETGGATCATSLSDGRGAGPQHEKGFASETAEATGQAKSTINRALSRADIPQEVLALLSGTKLDKGTYLDRLVGLLKDGVDIKKYVEDDLAAIARQEADKAAQERDKARKKEAKKAAERARIELREWLCDVLTPDQWSRLIALMEAAGGKVTAKELREHMAP